MLTPHLLFLCEVEAESSCTRPQRLPKVVQGPPAGWQSTNKGAGLPWSTAFPRMLSSQGQSIHEQPAPKAVWEMLRTS